MDDRITPTLAFAGPQNFTAAPDPLGVATADFNGDGQPDLAVANSQAGTNVGTVSVLLNTTPSVASVPAFAVKRDFATGSNSYAVAVGDINGDARPDLVVTNSNSNTVSVLLNITPAGATTANFTAQQTFATGSSPHGVVLTDVNGDGRLDVAVTNYGSNTVSVLLNTTLAGSNSASFATQQTLGVGSGPSAVAAGDFNGDGRPDLAVTNYFSNTVSVLVNATSAGASFPSFFFHQDFATGSTPNSVAVGDLNSDGVPDLAVANPGSNTVSVLLNATSAGNSFASFASQSTFATGSYPVSVATADLSGDGVPDLAVANYSSGSVSVLQNTTFPGAVTPTFAPRQSFGTSGNPFTVTVADFFRDGRLDLATANPTADTVSVLSNTSTGATVTSPVTVGQFGNTGVWRYDRQTGGWLQLTAANADKLAVAPTGDAVANFGGNGVWFYRAAVNTWSQINGNQASAVAIDQYGTPCVCFPNYGTYQYHPSNGGYTQLGTTGATADKLAVSAHGDVIANFVGYGLYRFTGTTNWVSLTGASAVALAVGADGTVAASFSGYGTYRNTLTGGWVQINGVTATSLSVSADGTVAAIFPGYGVAKYIPYASGWASLTANTAGTSVAADLYGNVFVDLNGFGVYEYSPAFGWFQRRNTNANLLSLA